MRKTIVLVFLVSFFGLIGFAQEFDQNKLDDYFNALEENDKFMGSVALSKNGVIIYSKSIGHTDIEKDLKADENSKYRIGSISKTFTAVLVLKAREEGKLDLNQSIDTYFPSIENADKITIENLLHHRSGIHNFTNNEDYLTWNTEAKTEEEMLSIIAKGGSDFEPDSKAHYSNSNYVLLSYILEKELNTSYADLLQKNIIEPVGLENTSFGSKIDPKKNECNSYRFMGKWKLEPETDMSVPLGAGGIISTPVDMTKFSDYLFAGKILKPESLELMKTLKDDYGLGLFQIPFYGRKGYGHTGGIDGFTSIFAHFDDGNISYALTSNGSNYEDNKISIAVLSAVYDRPYEIPTFITYQISSEELDAYLGLYSSDQIPLQITITKDEQTLIAQGTGQPSFPLEATEKDKFKFDQADLVLEFNPSEKTMLLKQAGQEYTFTRE